MSLKEQLAGELYKAVIKKIEEKKSMSDLNAIFEQQI